MTAVALAAAAGYGNYVLISANNQRVPILVLARPVAWGHVISDADLAIAQAVPDPAAHTVRATDRSTVVGKTATTTLPAGSVLAAEELTTQSIPGPGQRMVGLLCKPGQLPARGLHPGDLVEVSPVVTGQPSTDQGTNTATVAPFQARVADIGAPDANGAATVDVLVGPDIAVNAAAAAAGQVVLVLLGPNS